MADPSQYLDKAVKVSCTDKRELIGILVCISSPFSIILNHAVAEHPKTMDIDLEFHYTPQFPAKYFVKDETLRNAFDNFAQAKTEEERQQFSQKVIEAKTFNDEFMKNKYVIGSVVIPGEFIEKVVLL